LAQNFIATHGQGNFSNLNQSLNVSSHSGAMSRNEQQAKTGVQNQPRQGKMKAHNSRGIAAAKGGALPIVAENAYNAQQMPNLSSSKGM